LRGREPELCIKLLRLNGSIVCNIMDNGDGFQNTDQPDKASVSLKILKERIENYSSGNIKSISLQFKSNIPFGVNVELIFELNSI
jgi:hypothetical protein